MANTTWNFSTVQPLPWRIWPLVYLAILYDNSCQETWFGENKIVIAWQRRLEDTGEASMAGFADVPGTEIIVFIKRPWVSVKVQRLQMTTQTGENTHVIAWWKLWRYPNQRQAYVQLVALREELANKLQFSSANSMNIDRLVPQIVYYVYAYAQLVKLVRLRLVTRLTLLYRQAGETLEISWLPLR